MPKDEIRETGNRPVKATADLPETTRGGTVFRPLADIVETPEGVVLMLDLPGVGAEDVDVTLDNRVLTIRAKVHPMTTDKLEMVHREYGEGDFERAFTMSDDFDPDKIEATMHNGVLTLKLQRAAASKPKKISVKGA